MGNGFKITGCHFGFNRSRGVIIKAGEGEIRGNRFEGCEMTAILISPEYWWLEAGSGHNVKVLGNTIGHCGQGVSVLTRGGRGTLAPAGGHSNIVVAENTITDTPGLHIRVASTKGLTLRANQCDPQKIKIENCTDVTRQP